MAAAAAAPGAQCPLLSHHATHTLADLQPMFDETFMPSYPHSEGATAKPYGYGFL